MEAFKRFTSLEQSKILAKILPLESADMYYFDVEGFPHCIPVCKQDDFTLRDTDIPCWSLAALLNILHFPILSKDNIGKDKIGWMVSVYPDNCRFDSIWYDNPIDPCYEMILKLNKFKIL